MSTQTLRVAFRVLSPICSDENPRKLAHHLPVSVCNQLSHDVVYHKSRFFLQGTPTPGYNNRTLVVPSCCCASPEKRVHSIYVLLEFKDEGVSTGKFGMTLDMCSALSCELTIQCGVGVSIGPESILTRCSVEISLN